MSRSTFSERSIQMNTWLVLAALHEVCLQAQAYMVLSGGLGSSPYIQRRLQARYGTAAGASYPNAYGMQILLAEQP
jgi:hypothetical protein